MAARPLVDDAVLVAAARKAAAEAIRVGAFDEASDHLAVALDLTSSAGATAERAELLLKQGRVLWAAERAEGSRTMLGEAASVARRLGDGVLRPLAIPVVAIPVLGIPVLGVSILGVPVQRATAPP